ncbi:efflux RND transporter permease subunit [Sphingomonas sp. UYP23]
MTLAKAFLRRPVLAYMLATLITVAGGAALLHLQVRRFPDIAPQQVIIHASYPGASAETLESSVTALIEQQLNGLQGLSYFESSSDSNSGVDITLTFDQGVDPDIVQVQTQSKVQQILPRLPKVVQDQGVGITKSNANFLMFVTIYDQSNRASPAEISDLTISRLQDGLARVPGVGEAAPFTKGHAMRIWLDPSRLAIYHLMPSDVANAVAAQNVDLSAGQIGQAPTVHGQQINAVVKMKSRLQTPQQFADVIVKAASDGSVVRISDVARVELGQDDYGVAVHYDGHPASGLNISLSPGADALKTAALVKMRAGELAVGMPAGYALAFPRDSSDFVKLSIHEVVETLLVAIFCVVTVILLFLGSWRAALVPAIAVPVVLLGTAGVLAVLGYSLNTMTLFGMVLAIGLLVDDAIVVVEGVERIIQEEGLSVRRATALAMERLGSALIGVALVLSAVMAPLLFFGGPTGVIYRQFAVTIVSAMLLSVFVAVFLSPSLCVLFLRPRSCAQNNGTRLEAGFARIQAVYQVWMGRIVSKPRGYLLGFVILCAFIPILMERLPTTFLPSEDQGQVFSQFSLPANASADRTADAMRQVEHYFLTDERRGVAHLFTSIGSGLSASGANTGGAFATLTDFSHRDLVNDGARVIARRAAEAMNAIPDADAFATTPPAISGLGSSDGFSFQLLNRSGVSRDQFAALRDRVIAAAQKDPLLANVRNASLPDAPQLRINLDESKLAALGVKEDDATATLASAWGPSYIGDFIDRGRVKRVYMEGDAPYRMLPSNLGDWYVRSSSGDAMTPFAAFARTDWDQGPSTLSRFQGQPAYEIDGEAAPNASSGDAMNEIVAIQKRVAPQLGYDWSGLSRQETQASGQAPIVYGVALLVVFVSLAALYESLSVPTAVLLSIPLGVIGAAIGAMTRGVADSVYFQVGLLTTIGLAAKNATLIVEFAEMAVRGGTPLRYAAIEAARLRFRPVVMTSTALVAGVLPLALASGAGAQSRIAIGTSILGGVVSATILGVFLVPAFFVVTSQLFDRFRRSPEEQRG